MVEIESDDIVILILSILAQGYITPRLPKLPESGLLSVLNDPTIQAVLVIIGMFIVIRKIWRWLRNIFGGDDVRRRGVSVRTTSNPPDITLYRGVIRYGDVNWDGAFGLTRGSEIVHVNGPSCPVCGSPLETRTKHRRLLGDKELWDCPSCRFDTVQDHSLDGPQTDAVKSILENEARIAIEAVKARKRNEVQTAINDVISRAKDTNPRLETYFEDPDEVELTDSMMDDIRHIIDGTIDEEEIRKNSGLRAVLKHEFDYSLPSQKRNYDIVSEKVNKSKIRRRI